MSAICDCTRSNDVHHHTFTLYTLGTAFSRTREIVPDAMLNTNFASTFRIAMTCINTVDSYTIFWYSSCEDLIANDWTRWLLQSRFVKILQAVLSN